MDPGKEDGLNPDAEEVSPSLEGGRQNLLRDEKESEGSAKLSKRIGKSEENVPVSFGGVKGGSRRLKWGGAAKRCDCTPLFTQWENKKQRKKKKNVGCESQRDIGKKKERGGREKL